MHDNLVSMAEVARALEGLPWPVVFVGGTTIGLYLQPFGAMRVRVTEDVDCVVPVRTRTEFAELEQQLRQRGFEHHAEPGAPVCRWRLGERVVDIMPDDEHVLGFTNRFYRSGCEHARTIELDDGTSVSIMRPAWALATKVEAFQGRGTSDPWVSEDLEDIVALLASCDDLLDDLSTAGQDVTSAVAQWACAFMVRAEWRELIEAHLVRRDWASRVEDRLNAIAAMQ